MGNECYSRQWHCNDKQVNLLFQKLVDMFLFCAAVPYTRQSALGIARAWDNVPSVMFRFESGTRGCRVGNDIHAHGFGDACHCIILGLALCNQIRILNPHNEAACEEASTRQTHAGHDSKQRHATGLLGNTARLACSTHPGVTRVNNVAQLRNTTPLRKCGSVMKLVEGRGMQ